MCWGFLAVAAQPQPTVRPGRQRRVHQPPIRVEHGEVDRGARAVQICHKATQPVWQRLFAAHAGQSSQRHVETAGGLLESVGEQRVRRQLREDPVAVLQSGLHRRGEPHRAAHVVHPVPGVAHRLLARVEQGRRVEGNFRCHRIELGECVGQLVEDRIDLRRMRGDVDGDLAGHHVTLLPGRDQLANRLGGTADHRGLRRGHHRHHDVLDAARRQLRKHLLGRQFHRRHGAGTGDAGHQPRAAADDAQPVFQRQRARDDSRRGLAQRMPDDRARAHAVCLQGGGQRDLHR